MHPTSQPRGPQHRRRTGARKAAAVVGGALLVLFVTAGPAAADTAQSGGRSLYAGLFNGTLVSSGSVTSVHDGTNEVKQGNTTPPLSLLGGQVALNAGVLVQDALSNGAGLSAACAGLVGGGGSISIGADGNCAIVQGTPGGVVIDLGPLAQLRADSIIAQCVASSDGTATAKATIANAQIFLLGAIPINLPLLAPPNTGIAVPGLATVLLNEQSPGAPGSISAAALHVNLLGVLGGGVDLRIGDVICGPNAATPPIPVVPMDGVPIAGGLLALLGGGWLIVKRRRSALAPVA